MARLLMSYRPYICPFETLIPLAPQDGRVLDIGCGGGLMLSLLAASGRIEHGLGFDTNEPMTQLADQVAREHGLPLTYEARSVEQGLPPGDFNTITIIDVMHHIPPIAQASFLEDVIAYLPPGGRLIYKDMCKAPRWRALANRMHDLALAKQWIHYFPIEQVDTIAQNRGLIQHASESINRAWYGHELRVYDRPA